MRKETLATIFGQLLIEHISMTTADWLEATLLHNSMTTADCLEATLAKKFPELSTFHRNSLAALIEDTMIAIYRIVREYNPNAAHDDKYAAAYDEEATLQRLESNVTALTNTVAEQSEQLDYDPTTNTFLLLVNDQPHEFIAGGPQLQALQSFIENMI